MRIFLILVLTAMSALVPACPGRAQAANRDARIDSDRYERARQDYQLGAFSSAIHRYSAILKQDPDNSDARRGRGLAYMRLGDFEQAMDDFSEADKNLG